MGVVLSEMESFMNLLGGPICPHRSRQGSGGLSHERQTLDRQLPRCSWELPGLRVTGRAATTVSHLHARWSSRVTVAFLKLGFFRTISIFLTWRTEPAKCLCETTWAGAAGAVRLLFPAPGPLRGTFPRKSEARPKQ